MLDPLEGILMCPCVDCVDGRARMIPLLFPDWAGEDTTEGELAAQREALGICSECGHPHGTLGCQHGDGTDANPLCGCHKLRKDQHMPDVMTTAEFIKVIVPMVLGMLAGGLIFIAAVVALELWRERP